VGTWCFNASFAPTPDGNYTAVAQQTGAECFTVTPASSSSTTTASLGSVVIGPTGTATDSVTVTGNPTGGPPDGTVAFSVCGPLPGPGLCPSGTAVLPDQTLTAGSGITSSATSGGFTPTSVGTWCFAAVYTPGTGSNYTASSDNISGTPDPAECFAVTPATPGFTTTILAPSVRTVGNPWGDTATVAGNAAGGPPTGTVTWTLCQESTPSTPCTGGTGIGSDNTPTMSGNNSTFTLPNPQTPTAPGTYCFNASFAATAGGNYSNVSQQTGTECFTVNAAPNFTVIKTVAGGNGTPVTPGAVVTYTIRIENLGGATGSAVVTDTIPSQLMLMTSPSCAVTTPDVCTVANPTGRTWTFSVTLAPNHTATVTVSGTVGASATGTIGNTATITTGPCIVSDACSSSVSNPINMIPPAGVSPITPTQIPVTG
jgi:uncharacterized repeat protein (TIGR01451 family)